MIACILQVDIVRRFKDTENLIDDLINKKIPKGDIPTVKYKETNQRGGMIHLYVDCCLT